MDATPVAQQKPNFETFWISSRTSSLDSQRRSKRQDSIGSKMSGGRSFSTPQINYLHIKELHEQQSIQTNSAASSPRSQPAQSATSEVNVG